MKLGNNFFYTIFFLFIFSNSVYGEDRITSTPLINLEELKPSFEEVENQENEDDKSGEILKKKKSYNSNKSSKAEFIGLDKITAKTSQIEINIGESKKFGPLEIKVLKCAKVLTKDKRENSIAYVQVKDLTENQNEKVFIFNGWTFSSDTTVAPFDHAIYDLQLINCNKV